MDAAANRAARACRPLAGAGVCHGDLHVQPGGVPPFAGFFAKFFVFSAAVRGGWAWLAAIAMLNSAIGAYYYLRITVAMYFEGEGTETLERREPSMLRVGVVVAAIFTILIGIYPTLWASLFQGGLGS